MSWSPKFALDLDSVSVKAFQQFLLDFEEWRKTQKPRELDLTNGWKVITPEIAEDMLLRNPIGANRKPALPTVKYYARQMKANDWAKTGQPIIFDTDGSLRDAGHRLLACYLSGATFSTYLVGDVPPSPTLFAYIDNSKARSPADALATAGLNGLAKLLSSVVSIALHVEYDCYTPTVKRPLPHKVSPIEVIRYATEHENMRLGARLMAGEYKAAQSVLVHKDVAAYAAFQIIEIYDEHALETFMTELGTDLRDPVDGSAVAALQKVMAEDANSREPMSKHQVLGYVIKAFNAWHLGENVRRLSLKVNEPFPRFVAPEPVQQAAE